MPFTIHRKRQVVGLIYILIYLTVSVYYAVCLEDDQSWAKVPKFSLTVAIWFVLSLAVKVSMLMNRTIELLNLLAVFTFLSIGFFYTPRPNHFLPIEAFCYYLQLSGGTLCDVCDFIYEAGARRSDES